MWLSGVSECRLLKTPVPPPLHILGSFVAEALTPMEVYLWALYLLRSPSPGLIIHAQGTVLASHEDAAPNQVVGKPLGPQRESKAAFTPAAESILCASARGGRNPETCTETARTPLTRPENDNSWAFPR